ncbi:uncharacterized protein LOC126880766 [Diabrotica virgifera virgifera]|uniref:Peptidase aspartic putative domain-containing protein n=1 Tax=Diabrotica virgifera virgifera TaxID=50390 RepID=A0ABM5JS67_DIAVI|nr:uncharacterized protein LOC126880766 [Diabrotica virgifera virgifera]
MDCCSEVSYITEKCLNRLNLPRYNYSTEIGGINQMSSSISKGLVQCQIKPQNQISPLFNFQAVVVDTISARAPSFTYTCGPWEHLKNLKLAVLNYFESKPIDVLLGCEYFVNFLTGDKLEGPEGQPSALETIFGWVIMGKIDENLGSLSQTNCYLTNSSPSIENIIAKFWEVEKTPSLQILSSEDQQAESIFKSAV